MIRPQTGLLLAGLAFAGPVAAQEAKPAPKPPTAAEALAKAQKHHRRVLLTFLAADDERSNALAKVMKGRDLAHLLQYEFEVGQVRPLDQANAGAGTAAKYGIAPQAAAMPALVVLDADGVQLAAFGPKDLFDADGVVQTAALTESLKKLTCAPLDGEQVLAAALATAKKADKRVLLTFDAPW
jgi:hypothetical protein